jgi:hypothetical protein
VEPEDFKGSLAGLRPCASHLERKPLLKHGLVHWKYKPGHRFPSLALTNKGYQWRKLLGLDKVKT